MLIYRREFCSMALQILASTSSGPEDMRSQNLESHGAKLAMIDEQASLPSCSRLALRDSKNALLARVLLLIVDRHVQPIAI